MTNAMTGSLLALNLAGIKSSAEAQELIQAHLDAYDRDDALLVLAVALAALSAEILLPAVERMTARDEWRNQHQEAVRQIVAGPTEKEH